MTTASPPAHDIDWRRGVRSVVWVPEEHRQATVSRAVALRMLRCTERSFAQLIDLGLPSVEGADGPLFDPFDLKNASLYSGTGATEVELSMRFLLSFMKDGAAELTKPVTRAYRLQLRASRPGAADVRRVFRPSPEAFGGELRTWSGTGSVQARVEGDCFWMATGTDVNGVLVNCGAEQVASAQVRSIVDDVIGSGVRWHYLPSSMVARPEEVFGLGGASCSVLCSVLERRLSEAGFVAIAYHGWINAAAAVDHGWVEVVDDDGRTKSLDPSLAMLSVANGLGTPAFAEFAIGSMSNRVMPTRAPLHRPFVVDGEDGETVAFSSRVV